MDVTAIDMFLSVRSYFSREHVVEIAEVMHLNDVPFCRACADWHFPDVDHTED